MLHIVSVYILVYLLLNYLFVISYVHITTNYIVHHANMVRTTFVCPYSYLFMHKTTHMYKGTNPINNSRFVYLMHNVSSFYNHVI